MARRLLSALAAVTALLAGSALPAVAGEPDVPGLVDPETGRWYLRDADGDTAAFYFGDPGDEPFVGDWDCDGVDTPGLYRRSDGFVYLRNSNTQGPGDIRFFFGNPGDFPLAGDWDGDGCDTVSIYRPAESRIYVINRLGQGEAGLGAADFSYVFGDPGDAPFVADFDGDGDDEVGLRRESTGFAYLRFSLTTGVGELKFFYGDPGDKVLAGDWDDDGVGTVGIYRPSAQRFFLRNANAPGFADLEHAAGDCGWLPVAGAFGDLAPGPVTARRVAAQEVFFPVFVDAPEGDPRLFVVSKPGRIRVISGCRLLPTAFLDIAAKVNASSEAGLIGLAFHPDFATNGRFFAHYNDVRGDTVVSEFRVSATDPNRADPASERVLLTVDQPDDNHNGGMLAFDPDGHLYIALGDGGHGTSPAQDVDNLLGSILRIDVDGALPYGIPAGNPFDGGNGRAEIWAYGLRNPWRFSIDPATGNVYIGDVGHNAWEEVDVLAPAPGGPLPAGSGANLGWPIMEGAHCYTAGCDPARYTLPLLEYGHGPGCSVIGGYVYRGEAIPTLDGTYLYGDLCAGRVRAFEVVGGAAVGDRELIGRLGSITSFGTDGYGEVYVMTTAGVIYKIVPGG